MTRDNIERILEPADWGQYSSPDLETFVDLLQELPIEDVRLGEDDAADERADDIVVYLVFNSALTLQEVCLLMTLEVTDASVEGDNTIRMCWE